MARRPPPPPTKAVLSRSRVHEIDLKGKLTHQEILFHAMLIYIQTPGLSVREMWRTRRIGETEEAPLFSEVIAYKTLEEAATRGKWRERREQHWVEIEERVINALQDKTVQAEVRELTKLQTIESTLLNYIEGVTDESGRRVVDAVKPRSLEGAVSAFLAISKYRDAKRDSVTQRMAESSGTIPAETADSAAAALPGGPIPDDELSDEEFDLFVRGVLKKRAGVRDERDVIDAEDDAGELDGGEE